MTEPTQTLEPPAATRGMAWALVRLLRPKQWSKNLLVFAAYLFTGGFADSSITIKALTAFGAMCLISSAVYAVNDYLDRERDRLHPTRRNRPIASGQVSEPLAMALAAALLAGGFLLALSLGRAALIVLVAYLLLQIAYNLVLKSVAIADVFCIALGFVLRAVLGAAALHVPISPWLLLCTGAIALMLGFGKRRSEFISRGDERALSRPSLSQYSLEFLNAMLLMMATAAVMCYGVYSINSQTATRYPMLFLTTLPVVYGISRYLLLVFQSNEGSEPADVLFRDKQILASVILFTVLAAFAVSGNTLPLLEP